MYETMGSGCEAEYYTWNWKNTTCIGRIMLGEIIFVHPRQS